MRKMVFGATMATVIAALLVGSSVTVGADPLKLSGCLVRGQGDDPGYLLVNSRSLTPPDGERARTAESPNAIGTSRAGATVFYWLDNDDDLKPHVGHEVEIEGEVEGDAKDGKIELERKAQWTELKIESDGREMTAQVPHALLFAPQEHERSMRVLVRRVEADKVRMLSASCG